MICTIVILAKKSNNGQVFAFAKWDDRIIPCVWHSSRSSEEENSFLHDLPSVYMVRNHNKSLFNPESLNCFVLQC